mgnify:CR=1 FL=1
MYTPRHFKVTDMKEILNFVQENSFGTIVTTDEGKPIATHLPFILNKIDDDYYLSSHFAYGNLQWKTLEDNDQVLVIFQGPHAYVSSSWYGHENVPTWNYQAVHIYGKAKILTKDELREDLANLLEKYEKHRENPILWETLSPDMLESQMKGVVGFKVKVEEVQAAYKLSQNRNEEDYENIIHKLKEEESPVSKQVALEMERIKHQNL